MNQNKTCSLIEDLLPLYAEGLVSERSKQEIEQHLKKCDKCLEAFKSIKEESTLFLDEELIVNEINDNREKEIKCIKNIKRKITLKILMGILISITLTFFCMYILDTYRIIKDEDGKYILYNTNTGNIKKGLDSTNVLAKYTLDSNGKDIEYNTIFTFDKDGICINARAVISGYNEQEMNNYKNSCDDSIITTNIEIKEQKLYMNMNLYIGKTKQIILGILKEYKAQVLEI